MVDQRLVLPKQRLLDESFSFHFTKSFAAGYGWRKGLGIRLSLHAQAVGALPGKVELKLEHDIALRSRVAGRIPDELHV